MQRERGGSVPGECLEIPDGFAALGEQGKAAMSEIVEADGGRPACKRSGL